jgi:hypothetical protein
MTWLEKAERLSRAALERESAIRQNESSVYECLWDELKKQLEDVRRLDKFANISTNGQPRARVISLPVNADSSFTSPTPARSATIVLSQDAHTITATYLSEIPWAAAPHAADVFAIDVHGDGVVGLTYDGRRVTTERAAIHILWSFLYPTLPTYAPDADIA